MSSGGQDRPTWAAEGLVLTAASTTARLNGTGEDTSSQLGPSIAVAETASNSVIVLTRIGGGALGVRQVNGTDGRRADEQISDVKFS